jgi:hypothetical protein
MTALQEFLNSQAGLALVGMLGVAFADFATGAFAALRDGTFALDALAAFLLGYYGGEGIGQLFLAAAIAAALAYSAETASSILGNLNPPKAGDVQEVNVAEEVNPVPND